MGKSIVRLYNPVVQRRVAFLHHVHKAFPTDRFTPGSRSFPAFEALRGEIGHLAHLSS